MKDGDILFRLCKAIFWVGGGNFWYDEQAIGDQKTLQYRILSFVSYLIQYGLTFFELMAVTMADVTDDERCNAMACGVSHVGYILKILFIKKNRRQFQRLLRNLIDVCDSLEDDSTAMNKYKQIKRTYSLHCSLLLWAVISFAVQGILLSLAGGHFYMIITYYGTPSEDSLRATIFRFGAALTVIALLIIVVITVDGPTIFIMIIFKYKFIILKKYFENLNDDMLHSMSQKNCSMEFASSRLCYGVKRGIVMHTTLLRIAKDLEKIFGSIMTVQLFNSSFPAVLLLLQMAVSKDVDILTSLKVLAFIGTIFFLLGIYICTFGDITCEALSLPDAIFYCGWHLCPETSSFHRTIRAMVIMGCAQGQIPITIKAFEMVELTHATYVEVIKSTYSVYALIQAQNAS